MTSAPRNCLRGIVPFLATGGFRKGVVLALTVAMLMLTVLGDSADARGRRRRRSRGRSSAAAAAAKKKQMAQQIQKQIAQAQKILAVAQSRTAMSQQQVNQALSELSALHGSIEAARLDVQETAKTLRTIEQEILEEQPHDSALARAQAALDKAKRDLHQVVHKYAGQPDDPAKSDDAARQLELAHLSPAARKALEADNDYQNAKFAVEYAGKAFAQERQRLLDADPEWTSVQQDLLEAEKTARESSQQAETAGLGSLGDRQDLRHAQKVAAQARAVIIRGQAKLRALGVKSSASSGTSNSKR